MPFCPICEIRFRDKRGLNGHFRFKHRIEYNTGKPARDTAFTKAIGKNIDRRVSGDVMMKALGEKEEEGIEHVEEKRRRIPKSASMPEKRRRVMELSKDLGMEEERSIEDDGLINEVEMIPRDKKFVEKVEMIEEERKFIEKVEFD